MLPAWKSASPLQMAEIPSGTLLEKVKDLSKVHFSPFKLGLMLPLVR